MLLILISVLGGLAVFAWGLAVIAAVQLVRISPKGQRMRIYGQLGWWRFDEIRAAVGPAADQPIRVYQRAFVAFIACVLIAMVVGTLVGAQAQN